MSSQPYPVPHPWRRYLRFSVRGLIVVVLVIGAWLGWMVEGAHIQRDVAARIRKAGGSVVYEWDWRDGNSNPVGKPWAPRWLVDLIGVDYFGRVTMVQFSSVASATDASLADVGHLSGLQYLGVLSPSITDAGLARLKTLRKLSRLYIDSSQVTDAGLAHLKGLNELSVLSLRGTQVTDAGLEHLKGLTNSRN
jgi:internalin A